MDKKENSRNLGWRPKAYLFDFEGTLVTFEWNLKEGMAAMLKGIVSSGYSLEKLKKTPSYVNIHDYASEIKEQNKESTIMDIINNIFDQFDADALTRWSLNPCAKSTIKKLKEKGFPVGLVTNVGSNAIEGAINTLGLENLFDSVITRNDVRRLKPSPESLHLASKALKVNQDSVLFIGDSFDDIGAARAAGMKCCFIKGGQDIVHLEYPYKPIIIINSLEELINN
jgi:phosphoglycolate phosphatase